jgi:hypothetical protein
MANRPGDLGLDGLQLTLEFLPVLDHGQSLPAATRPCMVTNDPQGATAADASACAPVYPGIGGHLSRHRAGQLDQDEWTCRQARKKKIAVPLARVKRGQARLLRVYGAG